MEVLLDKKQLAKIIKKHRNNFCYYRICKYKYYEQNLEEYSQNIKEIISCYYKKCLISGPNLNQKRYEDFIVIKFKNNENEICCLNVKKSEYFII